tara:strand:- start:2540 stop:2656 length:117 start_codon:yes stop_codon:yes gene_type:complete
MKEEEINKAYMDIVTIFSSLPKEEQVRLLPLLKSIHEN